jgi:hypothetical protein
MFVHYFVHVPQPAAEVVRKLTDAPGQFNVWGQLAYEGWDELRTRLQAGTPALAKEVAVVVGTPRRGSVATMIPITWRATSVETLFPVLHGDLVIEEIADDLTQITLQGSYRPPLGHLGKMIDAVVLHRLAEACVKDFMNRMASAVAIPT